MCPSNNNSPLVKSPAMEKLDIRLSLFEDLDLEEPAALYGNRIPGVTPLGVTRDL